MNDNTSRQGRQSPQIVYMTGADAVPRARVERAEFIAPAVGDWVLQPALAFWAMGAGAGAAAAYLLGASLFGVLAWAALVGGVAGTLIGGIMAILRPTERSRTITEYQPVTVQAADGRYIPLHEAGGRRQLRIEQASLIVGGVTFRPPQLDAMRAAMDTGRLTRRTGGWSGPEYQRVTEALMGAGYLQRAGWRAWEWTDAGIAWLSPAPPPAANDGGLAGDRDDDDRGDQ